MTALFAVFVPLLVAYAMALVWCVDRWNAPTEYFTHCWLVPFVGLGVVLHRRKEWSLRPRATDLRGLWLLVPALVAIQQDAVRPLTAVRRAIRAGKAPLRLMVFATGLLQVVWMAVTLGWAMATGVLHPVLRGLMPALEGFDPLRASLVLALGGSAVFAGVAYCVAALAFALRTQRGRAASKGA